MEGMDGIFWRDKGVVRFLAALDTVLAIFLFGFYLVGGVFLNTIIIDIPNGPLSKFTLILASTAIWVGVFFINFLQMSSAYNLFIVTYQDALGPKVTIQRSQKWIRTAFIVLGLLTVKMVYLSIRKSRVFPLVWVLCGVEVVIRIIGLYFVRESIDDIKQEMYIVRKSASTSKSLAPETKKLKAPKVEVVEV
ncbi:hypothetical protein Ocin01_12073 [Orchesella cincta]|uniref:Transmembrane protein n=1 Tax=Orchesella cincta TaxID=48709 RepID=A0A1D2MNF9_ORCCI|nr:hypothetical protein Ocin01_12073 [Orchesella cincta]